MIDQETLGASLAYTNKALEALKNVVHYLGVTTTTLSDGATTNPITIGDRSVTAVNGDMVFYNGTAYTWDGTEWQETLSIAQIITQIETIIEEIGNLSNLTTEEKSNLVGAINEIVAGIPKNLSDLQDDATHRLVTDTEKSTWGAKATTTDITNAINALDVSSVGGTGKYISAISEADGKISATAETMDEVPTQDSSKAVKSGGIKTAIDDSVSLKTATGNPITLTDAANANSEELLMTIEPVQDLHGYSKPWPAGGGKNIAHIDSTKIFNTNKNPSDPITGIADGMLILSASSNGYIRSENLVSYTINNPDSITVNMADTEAAQSYGVGIVVEIDDTKIYTLSLEKTGGNVRIGWLNSDGSNLSYTSDQTLPCILTPSSGAKYLMIVCCPGRNVEHTFSNIQLEVGTSASNFEPWENICPISGLTSGEVQTTNGEDTNTANITLGRTVYGGSVNFKTGVVTVTHGYIEYDGSSDENWGVNQYTNLCAFIPLPEIGRVFPRKPVIANEFTYYTTISDKPNGTLGISVEGITSTYDGVFVGIYGLASTLNEWKTYLASNPLQVCYELATPLTLTLTPAELELLKGNNTITANGAEISIEYYPNNAIGVLAERVDDKADKEDVDNAVDAIKYLTTSTTSFADAGARAGIQYGADFADIVNTRINDLSTGIFMLETSGPKLGVVLFKYTNVYYSGIILNYFAMNERKPLYFVYQDGTYGIRTL